MENQQNNQPAQQESLMAKMSKSQISYENKDIGIYLVLLCFLGGLGVADFYLGDNKKGLMRLIPNVFCCGSLLFITQIWAIVDGMKIVREWPKQ